MRDEVGEEGVSKSRMCVIRTSAARERRTFYHVFLLKVNEDRSPVTHSWINSVGRCAVEVGELYTSEENTTEEKG